MNYKKATGAFLFIFVISLGLYAFGTHKPAVVASSDDNDNDTDESVVDTQLYAAAAALAVAEPKPTYRVSDSIPQFVVLSFDGSKSVSMLDETLQFEKKMQTEGKSIHFTYFINAAYFLTKEEAGVYQAPRQAPGVSNIGFSRTVQEIPGRVSAFNVAFSTGNEIGSHTVGHFNGVTWSEAEWKHEFDSFATLMANIGVNNPSVHIEAPLFLTAVEGFRAPNLGANESLYMALGAMHFTYDTSEVGRDGVWPHKDLNGIWHIPLGVVYLGPSKKPIVAMDYSIWQHQQLERGTVVKGDAAWNQDYTEVEDAYMNYFDTTYNKSRAPIVIGGHFTKWNDGVYFEAMKAFAENVCGKPNVRCVTYKELVAYLNTTGAPPIAAK